MAEQKRPVAVLVDAYTSGNYLPPAFARLDADLVHVQSTPELLASMMPPNLDAYRAALVCDTPEATAARLAEYGPVCVVAGQEPGVPLADALSGLLGVPSNGTELSAARRDKYEMIEALRRAGVRCAEQFKSDDAEALVKWAENHDAYPVVVKPLTSAATDGVAVCRDADQVRAAAEYVLASDTIFETSNREALVQSYLAGDEYVVDMVSYEGKRYTCGVWQYRKQLIGTHNIYDQETIRAEHESPVPEVIAYTNEVLDALGIRFGPSHAEVIVTADGPTLVEVGARLSGNMHPAFHDQCVGGNQADLTALAYVRPQEFLDRYAGRTYHKVREATVYTAPTELDGVVDSVDEQVVREIEAIDSVYGLNVKLKPGGRIKPTVDLYTSTLRVFLTADSESDLERDYRLVQELKDRVYRLR
ncbi:ATP-grasp domain-containing protein [Streptomyces sp. NPDC048506]|uniref:ATP-grasp domain-containing protein n=1 Tax=Streptomyces sp. NPDC048506 TaxID=3155028 RepID=UPI00341BECEE